MDDALESLAVGVGDITSTTLATYPDVTGRPIEFNGVFGLKNAKVKVFAFLKRDGRLVRLL